MKPDQTHTPHRCNPAVRRGFHGGSEIIGTAGLRGMIPVLFSQLYALFVSEHVARGALTRIRDLRKALQSLYKAEKQNFCVWLTLAMKSDPVWQAQTYSAHAAGFMLALRPGRTGAGGK